MTPFQHTLFSNLEAIVASSEAFYRQEFTKNGSRFWIYNYRLASYTDFLQPGALECRGVMFEVDAEGKAIRLAALPFPKFFNYCENPFTTGLDLSKVDSVELKADGSLISTWVDSAGLQFKSKGSLHSSQVADVDLLIETFQPLKDQLTLATREGWTVNMEYCSPTNRIVIGYMTPHLKVLNARHIETGTFMTRQQLEVRFGEYCIDNVDTGCLNVPDFVASIPAMEDDIEGYICKIEDFWFKIKTQKYCTKHKSKDDINNPRRLFEAVIDEVVDDLRSMFAYDQLVIKQIDDMQIRVEKIYNHIVSTVELFFHENGFLDRKSYAIKGQAELSHIEFGLAMQLYVRKTADFKSAIKSKYKELGFADATNTNAE
jgi:T4 RnlA family RNA ligase